MSRVNYILICENVIKADKAKVSLINVYDRTIVSELPATGKLVIAIDVRLDRSEVEGSEIKFKLQIVAPDGRTIIASAEGRGFVSEEAGRQKDIGVITSLDLTGQVVFESEGVHAVELFVYGKKLATTNLAVELQESEAE